MKKVSERGVYYDLSLSPYEIENPYTGEIYKFSSAKKLDMYKLNYSKEKVRFQKYISKLEYLNIYEKLDLSNEMEKKLPYFIYKRVMGVVNGL